MQKLGEKPLVTFIFKYRSLGAFVSSSRRYRPHNNLDMLRAIGIAPKPSTASATHHDRPQLDIKPVVKHGATEIPGHDTTEEILSLEVSTFLQPMNLTDSYLPQSAPSSYSEEATVQL